MSKAKVLFVCVENSCRSQIAEGFARTVAKDALDAWSAGSKPSGRVNPKAVESMKEKGIDLELQTSKGLDDLPQVSWDYVVTMGCGDACPHLPAKNRLDWALEDPKHMPAAEFAKVRDEIESRVRALAEEARARTT